ncbi:hypothetical protein LX32DRAFT_330421 [Colletotrichum zoysiae]|uniref:Uncharacterized protein n=1 Tax=Colletotrichum zoysiae TaxID=1216348 RepID=A0AAD9HJS0_9PEZI|nr:hypothetical protein LX32DRAFT_330421 [Colletotrichum zoysiae]
MRRLPPIGMSVSYPLCIWFLVALSCPRVGLEEQLSHDGRRGQSQVLEKQAVQSVFG